MNTSPYASILLKIFQIIFLFALLIICVRIWSMVAKPVKTSSTSVPIGTDGVFFSLVLVSSGADAESAGTVELFSLVAFSTLSLSSLLSSSCRSVYYFTSSLSMRDSGSASSTWFRKLLQNHEMHNSLYLSFHFYLSHNFQEQKPLLWCY